MGETTAIHLSDNGDHVVGIGNLRVFIVQEGDYWCAQGLEIDYVAQGESIEEAKEAFESGLTATIHANIKRHGTIEHVLKVAPSEIWAEIYAPEVLPHLYSQVSLHEIESLPFHGIQYLQRQATSAA